MAATAILNRYGTAILIISVYSITIVFTCVNAREMDGTTSNITVIIASGIMYIPL